MRQRCDCLVAFVLVLALCVLGTVSRKARQALDRLDAVANGERWDEA